MTTIKIDLPIQDCRDLYRGLSSIKRAHGRIFVTSDTKAEPGTVADYRYFQAIVVRELSPQEYAAFTRDKLGEEPVDAPHYYEVTLNLPDSGDQPTAPAPQEAAR